MDPKFNKFWIDLKDIWESILGAELAQNVFKLVPLPRFPPLCVGWRTPSRAFEPSTL